jgi:hypothetical protein
MVFGFGKKKADQPIVPTQVEKTIQIEKIPDILHEIESPQIEEAIKTAKLAKNEIEVYMKKTHELILHLESDSLKLDEVDKNLAVIVKRGKNSIVTTIKKETSVILTDPTKYDQVISLNMEIAQMLKKIGDVLGINSRIIHIFAKKYADNLKEEIAKMAKNRNQLQISINSVEAFKTNEKTISDTIQKISEYKNIIRQKSDRISQIEKEIQSLKQNIMDLQKQIQDLRSCEEYKKFTELKRKIESTSEKSDIKSIIDLQFSKISRPLGRYSYISSFEKPVRMMMDEMLTNPYDVISTQNKNSIIQILEAVEKSVISGSISVKDSEKSLEQIQETITKLDEFILLKESYTKKASNLEKELTIFDIKLLESKEQSLKKTETDITNIESIRKKLEEEVNDNQQSLSKNVEDLESRISKLTNYKVSIDRNSTSKIN